MVICKYFQQGYCRYGQSCRFEHVYGSKYNYQAGAPQPIQSGVTDEQLVNQVQLDAQAALKGGQWLLSSYAPFKEKPIFPGISDLSPEEARLFIYEAQANNTLEQAIEYMNKIARETRFKYELLLKPTPEITKVLRSLYNGEAVTSPFSTPQNTFGSTANNATSIFRSAVQTTTLGQNNSSVFGQQENSAKSIFAAASQNVFGASQNISFPAPQSSGNLAAKSLFAQANQNVFGASQTPQANPANLFASAAQTIFSPSQQPQSSPFSNNSTNSLIKTQSASIFGKSTNIFDQKDENDTGTYSRLEELTEDDLEEFRNDSFKLGFIPEVPPAYSLCF